MEAIYTVSELNREIRDRVEADFAAIRVCGEISNLACPASGHRYFSLKEHQSVIRCAWFRNHQRHSRIKLEDGLQVIVHAQVSFYEARGDLQLIVRNVELKEDKEGVLRRQFEELKQKLQAEGLFAPERKKPLPQLPCGIGLITSGTGAAVEDISATIGRRYPATRVLLVPTQVQGDGAAHEVIRALDTLRRRADIDVIIIARGGGSIEDLQAFNQEAVARAIADCPIPVVTGIGHETDFTIADMVADLRAATPTAAAELATPERSKLLQAVVARTEKLQILTHRALRDFNQSVDLLQSKLVHPREKLNRIEAARQQQHSRLNHATRQSLWRAEMALQALTARHQSASPATNLQRLRQQLTTFQQLLVHHIRTELAAQHRDISTRREKIALLGPQNTLARGYAVVQARQKVVMDATQVAAGDAIRVTLARGEFDAVVGD